jgi:hypothetical protein
MMRTLFCHTVRLVPPVIDCGFWLAGGRKLCEFQVRNDGGEGRFALIPAASWPAINFKVLTSDRLRHISYCRLSFLSLTWY